jgi:hypothetical protein
MARLISAEVTRVGLAVDVAMLAEARLILMI